MGATEITEGQIGLWPIVSQTRQNHVLYLPTVGRASPLQLKTLRELLAAEPREGRVSATELVAWGSCGPSTSLGPGIEVGRSAVFVLQPRSSGEATTAILTAQAVRIARVR